MELKTRVSMERQLISHFASACIECADLFFMLRLRNNWKKKKDLKGLGHSAGIAFKDFRIVDGTIECFRNITPAESILNSKEIKRQELGRSVLTSREKRPSRPA